MRCAAVFVDGERRPTHKCYKLYIPTVEMLTTRDGPAVIDAKARYWSKIVIRRQNIAIKFGMEKLEWRDYTRR